MVNKFSIAELRAGLEAVAEEYDKRGGEPLTVVIVGGAAAVFNFSFYPETNDIDYLPEKSSPLLEECIDVAGARLDFGAGWMNEQSSYLQEKYAAGDRENFFSGSIPLPIKSERIFFRAQGLEWYLAMKLRAFRRYRHDATDILGLMLEKRSQGQEITAKYLEGCYNKFYGMARTPITEATEFLATLDDCPDLEKLRQLYFLEERYQQKIYDKFTLFLLNKVDKEVWKEIVRYHFRFWTSAEDIRKTFEEFGIKAGERAIKNVADCIFPFVYKLSDEEFLAEPVENLLMRQHKKISRRL